MMLSVVRARRLRAVARVSSRMARALLDSLGSSGWAAPLADIFSLFAVEHGL